MTVPLKVRLALMCLAWHSKRGQRADGIIRQWLHEKELLNDITIDMLVDAVGLQHDSAAFVRELETNEDVYTNGGNGDRYKDAY